MFTRISQFKKRIADYAKSSANRQYLNATTLLTNGSHRRLTEIENMNVSTMIAAQAWRRDYAAGKAELKDIKTLAREHRFFGVCPCQAGNIDFVMMHAHDDVVVWDYLWRGKDGYEPDMVSVWLDWCKTEGVQLDIGGYSGLMSILAARSNPQNQVHLFEVLDRQIERASINVKLNGLGKRVLLHPFAVSDSESKLEINIYRDENFLGTGNSIDVKDGIEVIKTKPVNAVSIDSFLPDVMPTAIKIDVEGHELKVLQGMSKMFERCQPNILIEVWERTRDQTLRFLESRNYDLVRVEPRDRDVNNYIAQPKP